MVQFVFGRKTLLGAGAGEHPVDQALLSRATDRGLGRGPTLQHAHVESNPGLSVARQVLHRYANGPVERRFAAPNQPDGGGRRVDAVFFAR